MPGVTNEGVGSTTITYALQSTKWYYKKAASEMGLHRKEPYFLALWAAWLLTGSLFYGFAPDFELGFVKGFYMAINIGYSIGFGYPMDANSPSIWFSTFYVLIGASFVGVALGVFAEKITQNSESWFSRLEDQKKIQDFILLNNENWKGRLKAWIYSQRSAIRAVLLWLAFIVVLIIVSTVGIGWSFKEAQYFAISTLSTGGHWMIPEDSPLWLYGVTGLLTMFGVPVMALAMGAVGQALMDQGSLEEAKAAINDPITKEELQMLEDLGLQEGDNQIDLSEFILLCMVRVGTDPGLLTYIQQRFKELSVNNQEFLTIEEITQNACVYVEGSVRRKASVAATKRPPVEMVVKKRYNTSGGNGTSNENENAGQIVSNHQSANIGSDVTTLPTVAETEASDIEEAGTQTLQSQPNAAPEPSIEACADVPNHQINSQQQSLSTVLQPRLDALHSIARPLRRRDDLGMALLDRSYVMSATEERYLLKEARRRSKLVLENSRDDIRWASKGKIAGVKISSKEGVDGSPINIIKGVTELESGISYDFLASQFKYESRNEDSWYRYYKVLDPLCIATSPVARVGSSSNYANNLLGEGRHEHEQCLIVWFAVRPPLRATRDRDVCIVIHSLLTQCPLTGDPVFLIHFFSVAHPAVPDMERALGRVRGEGKMGGYIVRPSAVNKDQNQVTFLVQYDPKGSLPISVQVLNAFSVSQGLKAGRYRDLLTKQHRMALKLNKATSPLGCYDMKRLGHAVHELQLITEEEEGLWDLSSARTYKFELAVYADSPTTMRIATKDGDGKTLPHSLARMDRSDSVGKKLAAGTYITFQHMIKTTLLITVEGRLPKALAVRFQNAFWRSNTVYVPAIVSLAEASPPDPSQGSSLIP